MKPNLLGISWLLISVSCICAMCKKDDQQRNIGGLGDTTITYKFSSPQYVTNLMSYNYPNTAKGFSQIASVKTNIVLKAIEVNFGNSFGDREFRWQLMKNGSFVERSCWLLNIPYYNLRYFDIDQQGTTLYFSISNVDDGSGRLYKCDLSAGQNMTPVLVSSNVGVIRSVKVLSISEVLLSSSLDNGSLIRVKDNGTIETIVTNLISPTVCALHNNEYYVVDNNSSGTVTKVRSDGSLSNLITNLNYPSNIVFDNNGNFVLQTSWTKDGGTYQIYELYKSDGTKISTVADDSNNQIITGDQKSSLMSLYVDENNNLYFSHHSQTSSGGLTYCNPNTTQNGIWKIHLIKE